MAGREACRFPECFFGDQWRVWRKGGGLGDGGEGDGAIGEAYHIVDGSTVILDKGHHPCVAAPGYEMYYFTILGGQSQRSLKQYFQPTHAAQLHTIPGIMDMVAKFK